MKTHPQTMQSLLHADGQAWTEGARAVGRRLLRTKLKITIEDILEVFPRPKYLHRNITGQVFRCEDFQSVGYTKAKKPSSNGRVIRLWTLSDKYSREIEGCD